MTILKSSIKKKIKNPFKEYKNRLKKYEYYLKNLKIVPKLNTLVTYTPYNNFNLGYFCIF